MYCAAARVSPPPPRDWAFYLALALFRLVAILAGVQARAKQVGGMRLSFERGALRCCC